MRPLLVLALLGCASPGGGAPPRRDRPVLTDERGQVYRTLDDTPEEQLQMVPGRPSQVLQSLVGIYESLGLTVNVLDTRANRVGAANLIAKTRVGGESVVRYVDCGTNQFGGARAATYELLLNVTSSVDSTARGESLVSTVLSAQGQQRGTSADPIKCNTTSALEQRIHLLVAERMAKQNVGK